MSIYSEADLGLLQNARWSANYYHKPLHLGCCSSTGSASAIIISFYLLYHVYLLLFCASSNQKYFFIQNNVYLWQFHIRRYLFYPKHFLYVSFINLYLKTHDFIMLALHGNISKYIGCFFATKHF